MEQFLIFYPLLQQPPFLQQLTMSTPSSQSKQFDMVIHHSNPRHDPLRAPPTRPRSSSSSQKFVEIQKKVDHDSKIPSWLFVGAGFTGMIGFNILVGTTRFVEDRIFNRNLPAGDDRALPWTRKIPLFRGIGIVVGCFCCWVCTQQKWTLWPHFLVGTLGHALATFGVATVLLVVWRKEVALDDVVTSSSRDSTTIILYWVALVFALFCGVGSSCFNAVHLGLFSSLSGRPESLGLWSIGAGIAAVVAGLLNLLVDALLRHNIDTTPQVLVLGVLGLACAPCIASSFLLGRRFFLAHPALAQLLIRRGGRKEASLITPKAGGTRTVTTPLLLHSKPAGEQLYGEVSEDGGGSPPNHKSSRDGAHGTEDDEEDHVGAVRERSTTGSSSKADDVGDDQHHVEGSIQERRSVLEILLDCGPVVGTTFLNNLLLFWIFPATIATIRPDPRSDWVPTGFGVFLCGVVFPGDLLGRSLPQLARWCAQCVCGCRHRQRAAKLRSRSTTEDVWEKTKDDLESNDAAAPGPCACVTVQSQPLLFYGKRWCVPLILLPRIAAVPFFIWMQRQSVVLPPVADATSYRGSGMGSAVLDNNAFKILAVLLWAVVGGWATTLGLVVAPQTVTHREEKQVVGVTNSFATVLGVLSGSIIAQYFAPAVYVSP